MLFAIKFLSRQDAFYLVTQLEAGLDPQRVDRFRAALQTEKIVGGGPYTALYVGDFRYALGWGLTYYLRRELAGFCSFILFTAPARGIRGRLYAW